jgi:hypothetical protein
MKLPDDIDATIAATGARVRIGYPWWLRRVLFANVAAITLGRRVWISSTLDERHAARIVRHELVHVRQFAELGLGRFVWRYVSEYVRNRRRGLSPAAAYAAISFEREAFAAEERETV